jgi:hypothetical protein
MPLLQQQRTAAALALPAPQQAAQHHLQHQQALPATKRPKLSSGGRVRRGGMVVAAPLRRLTRTQALARLQHLVAAMACMQ